MYNGEFSLQCTLIHNRLDQMIFRLSRGNSVFIAQTSEKQNEIDFQINANELYSIVKPARTVGIFGQTTLMTSIGIHAIGCLYFLNCGTSVVSNVFKNRKFDPMQPPKYFLTKFHICFKNKAILFVLTIFEPLFFSRYLYEN